MRFFKWPWGDSIGSSDRSPCHPPVQNRAYEFPSTRLLNSTAVVTSTFAVFERFRVEPGQCSVLTPFYGRYPEQFLHHGNDDEAVADYRTYLFHLPV